MNNKETLRNIAEDCRNCNTFEASQSIMERYRSLIDAFKPSEELSTSGLSSEYGVALAPQWAATCLDDHYRTAMYIKSCIIEVNRLLETNEKVEILYAGSGPYATLILPVLCYFSSSQIQVTLLEMNSESLDCSEAIITQLGLNELIREYLQEDAALFQLQSECQLVISETMQAALEREPQVAIFRNLYRQLPKDTVFIPDKISLIPALVTGLGIDSKILKLEPLLQLNYGMDDNYKSSFQLTDEMIQEFNWLVVLTEIHVSESCKIIHGHSGLTSPKVLHQLSSEDSGKHVEIRYVLNENPSVEYRFI